MTDGNGSVAAVGARLRAVPLTLAQANELVAKLHRHHKPARGHRFSIGAAAGDRLVAAVIVGRPVARKTDQYRVAEVTRLVTDGTANACSFLYGRAAQAAKAMGFDRIQTYTLATESGASLRGAGWRRVRTCVVPKNGWATRPGRFQGARHLFEGMSEDLQPQGDKVLWERTFG